MLGEAVTAAVQRSLGSAQEEAVRHGHPFVGTEHLVLGLLGEEGTVADAMFKDCRADRASIREMIERIIGPAGKGDPDGAQEARFTSRATKSLELAISEASFGQAAVLTTGHLLLGVVREAHGVAGQVLLQYGIDAARARAALSDCGAAGAADPD